MARCEFAPGSPWNTILVGHGRSATPQSNPSMGKFLITVAAASYSRFKIQTILES